MASDQEDDLSQDWDDLHPKTPKTKPKGERAFSGKSGILDVKELRETTQRAIQEGANKKTQAEMARAEGILLKATEKARAAAARGQTSCRIAKVRVADFDYRSKTVTLKGSAKVVFDRLKQAGMIVEIEINTNCGYGWDTGWPDVWIVLKW
jgi:hypothetical protein